MKEIPAPLTTEPRPVDFYLVLKNPAVMHGFGLSIQI